MKVGYIGLGAMGRALAGHLVEPFDLTVCDLSPEAVKAFVDRGAKAAATPEVLAADCDVVVLCLPRSADVEKVIFGNAGLARALRPGSLVVDQTSGAPSQTRSFAERLAAQGVGLIDAPVAGGVPLAIAGGITIMASGPASGFETAEPVLRAMTAKVFHCSPRVGDGQAVKMLNNIINAANRIATLEAVAVGRAAGLSMAGLASALNNSPARSFITDRLLPAIVEKRSSTDFALALMVKDLNQAGGLAMEFDAPTPLSSLARGVIQTALNTLGRDARLDDVVGFMETISATHFADGEGAVVELDPEQTRTLSAVIAGLAACKRLIILENAALAVKAGVAINDLAPVINAGSAWSGASLAVLPALTTAAFTTDETLGATVRILKDLAARGAAAGAPLLMHNAALAAYEAHAHRLGDNATLDAVTQLYEEAADTAFAQPDPSISRFG